MAQTSFPQRVVIENGDVGYVTLFLSSNVNLAVSCIISLINSVISRNREITIPYA